MLAAEPVPLIGHQQLVIFLVQAGSLLLLALLLGRVSARLGLTAVTGELCAGILAGPSVLGHVAPRLAGWLLPHAQGQFHLLDAVGQAGVVLLVGVTGMQMDLGLVRRKLRATALVGAGGLVLPLACGAMAALALPAAFVPGRVGRGTLALFLGTAFAVSALPVISRILLDLGLLDSEIGQITIAAATIDDTVGWLLLSACAVMASGHVRPASIALSLAAVAGTVLATMGAPPLFRAAVRLLGRPADAGPVITLTAALMLLAAAATEAMNLEAVIGAFACGIAIRASNAIGQDRLASLAAITASFFAPLYFASAGLRTDLTAVARPAVLLAAVLVLALAFISKLAGAYAGARLCRLPKREAVAIGAGISARGILGIVVAVSGLQLGVLSPAMYTIIVLVAIATSAAAPPMLRWAASPTDAPTAERRSREAARSGLAWTARPEQAPDPAMRAELADRSDASGAAG
jgi:Kef-type K+ transport system membrane component KefB